MAARKTKIGRKGRKVLSEFSAGTLRTGGSGKKVTDRKQAVAIALSEQRRANRRRKKR